MAELISVSEANGAMILRFERPEIRNPLSVNLLSEIGRVLDLLERKGSLSKLIFTGREGVFASGADLREIYALDQESAEGFARRGQELMDRISRLPITTIAAVNGFCYGGALDLALACETRIGSPDSTYCHPGAGLGIITGWGGTQRLPGLIGEAMALEMFFTAAPIAAAEALRIGLIDSIAADPVSEALTM